MEEVIKSSTSVDIKEQPKIEVLCMGSSLYAPCSSPFSLKLQTYLRMADIKYEVVSCNTRSSKGKIPFIKYDGNFVEDTTFIVEFLNGELGKNLNANLDSAEKAAAVAFQRLIEENLYWALSYQRWLIDDSIYSLYPVTNSAMKVAFSLLVNFKIRPSVKANMKGHGMGRHSKEQIYKIAERDLTALSNFLGDKPFLMGEQPSEIDASMFGFLAITIHGMEDSPSGQFIMKSLPNLVSYVKRMRDAYWPDWDELCMQGPMDCKGKEVKKGKPVHEKHGGKNKGSAYIQQEAAV